MSSCQYTSTAGQSYGSRCLISSLGSLAIISFLVRRVLIHPFHGKTAAPDLINLVDYHKCFRILVHHKLVKPWQVTPCNDGQNHILFLVQIACLHMQQGCAAVQALCNQPINPLIIPGDHLHLYPHIAGHQYLVKHHGVHDD